MSQKIYILGHYIRHENYGDFEYGAVLETEIDYFVLDTGWYTREDGVPPIEKIVFNAIFMFLNAYEYLDNNCYWTIVSQRMLDAIRTLQHGERVAAFPVTMIDGELKSRDDPRWHSKSIQFDIDYALSKPELHRDDFWVLRVPILKGALDKLESNYSTLSSGDVSEARITSIERHVLIEPPEGYPPIFRIEEYRGNVFVTEELRQAWKAAGVRGPVYRPLYNTWLTYEMDFPVEIEGENVWLNH